MSEPNQLATIARPSLVSADDFMPVLSVEQAVQRKEMINQFIAGVMHEGEDYGFMPGETKREKRKVLLKPGAEKMCSIFGLSARYVKETIIEDWTGAEHGSEPLFYYEYRCQLWRGEQLMGEAIGSANSWETKYRYRWMRADQLAQYGYEYPPEEVCKLMRREQKRTVFEFDFALDKRETTGQYGKPEHYWNEFDAAILEKRTRRAERETRNGMRPGHELEIDESQYRIPNPDAADLVNTLQKMAQKRALVAATLVVTNCSDAFTQDIEPEDPDPSGKTVDTGGAPLNTKAAQENVRDRKLADASREQRERPATKAEQQAGDSSRGKSPSPPAPTHQPEPWDDPATPAPLRALFEAIDSGHGRDAFNTVRQELREAMPENGEQEFRRIQKKRGLTAQSGAWELKAAIKEMWELAEFSLAEKLKLDAGFKATDADLPFEEEPAGAGRVQ